MSEEKALELGLTPKLYFRGFTVVGCQPDEMGIGPVYSIPKLLKSADLKLEDIDLWELNEASLSSHKSMSSSFKSADFKSLGIE